MKSPVSRLRSPHDRVGGLVYFGRMIDKIRLHLDGRLPEDYQPNLGIGFDERCVHFLKISYRDLVDRIAEHRHATDDELLEWALNNGRRPDDEEIHVWNEFARKRGWKDDATERREWLKAGNGLADRHDIETLFQFIDADEGRF